MCGQANSKTSVPPGIVCLDDYESFARETLPQDIWAYLSGGVADEITLRRNASAFGKLALQTRAFADVSQGNTRCTLFGETLDYPIILAPLAYHRLVHADAELGTVMGASAMKAAMVVSTLSSVSLEDMAHAAHAPLWFQLYFQADRQRTLELVRRAEQAGYRALVVTADTPVTGTRNRQDRAGFSLPPTVSAVNLAAWPAVRHAPAQAGLSPVFDSAILASAPTWRDLEWLRSQTRLPLLVKGLTSPSDALQATALGVDGIIVSNHGGRALDTQPASIDMLPAMADAVGKQLPLLLDGGIRRGTDVLKALALGATAVLIGRPYLYGLAVAGPVGVAHVLHILRAELEMAMVLTGCRSLSDVTAEVLWRHGEARPHA